MGGLGYCERVGRLWLINRKSIFQGRLKDGRTLRRLGFMDDDRYDAQKIELELIKLHVTSKLHSSEDMNDKDNKGLGSSQPVPAAVAAASHGGSTAIASSMHIHQGDQLHSHQQNMHASYQDPHSSHSLLNVSHGHHSHHHDSSSSNNHHHHQHHHHQHHFSAEGNLDGLLGPAFLEEEKEAEARDEKEMHALHAMVKEDVITAVTAGTLHRTVRL